MGAWSSQREIALLYWGADVCCAEDPGNVHGSPDQLVQDGVRITADLTGAMAEQIAAAIPETETTSNRARQAVERAAKGLDLTELERVVAERIHHGLMLGALDSVWEREQDEDVEIEAFRDRPRIVLARSASEFAGMPYEAALDWFATKEVLPRDLFDQLEDAAKRRAFTVARLTRQQLLDTARDELERQLRQTKGPDLRQWRRFVEDRLESAGWTPANPSHVETIYRTNVLDAYGAGRREEMSQPAVLEARPYWQIRVVGDSRTRPTHRAAANVVLPADHAFWQSAYPPFGYNCLLPGTRVVGSIIGASRARYVGQAVELTTAKGRRLTVTANHPVLTSRGLVPAQQIGKGDELISDCRNVASVPVHADGYEDHEPLPVEQVFGALADATVAEWAEPARGDFHGEAERFAGKVQVVGSYGLLALEMEAARSAGLANLGLQRPGALAPVPGLGTARGHGPGRAADRIMGRSDLGSPLLRGHARPLHTLRLGSPADLDSAFAQCAGQSGTADAEFSRQLLDRFTATVATDRVVGVRKYDWAGHVYDLESESGLIVADGIVTSNCRCRVVSRSARWASTQSIGPVPGNLPDPGFAGGAVPIAA